MFQIDFGSVDHLEQPFITSPWCEGLHSVRILRYFPSFNNENVRMSSDLWPPNNPSSPATN